MLYETDERQQRGSEKQQVNPFIVDRSDIHCAQQYEYSRESRTTRGNTFVYGFADPNLPLRPSRPRPLICVHAFVAVDEVRGKGRD